MAELSVIVPFCNEYPQVMFTLQSIAQELRGRVDFEVIAINNYCEEVIKQGSPEDKGYDTVLASERVNPWLRVLHYKEKLSHWQAKNLGVKESTGKFLWFCDAHCVVSRDSLYNMFMYYKGTHENLNGSLHLPLTYKILESHKLIYKLVYNKDIGEVHYSFTGYRFCDKENIFYDHYQVPCMSTCGMMITRDIYDQLGGWPKVLGIYGGGEHFINFTLAILGKSVNIFCGDPLFHHGEKRGYSWNYNDYTRNRIAATYAFGGKALACKYAKHRKGSPIVIQELLNSALCRCESHRDFIKRQQVISIEDWVKKWSVC